MSKRSMIKTSPDKIKDIDEKNPENKLSQSVQTNEANVSNLIRNKYKDTYQH